MFELNNVGFVIFHVMNVKDLVISVVKDVWMVTITKQIEIIQTNVFPVIPNALSVQDH